MVGGGILAGIAGGCGGKVISSLQNAVLRRSSTSTSSVL